MTEIAPLSILATAPAAAPTGVVAVARMPAELAGMAAGTILTGVIVGREPGGQTVIRTQHGALALKGGQLPMGGTVTVQLQQVGAQLQVAILSVDGGTPAHRDSPTASASGPPEPAPQSAGETVRMLAGHWDALAQALAIAPALERFVPNAGPQMAALALALIGALRRGTLADWIGRGEPRAVPAPLADRLAEDFTRMVRLAAPDPGVWRFIPLPLLDRGELQQVLLFVRRGHHHDGTAEDDAGTRILVEIDHPRLGRMQIDALVRARRLDVMVRSHAALPSDLRARLTAIHDEARAFANLLGAIGFQPGGRFVAPPLAADAFGVTA